jgi:hypothetical protein
MESSAVSMVTLGLVMQIMVLVVSLFNFIVALIEKDF